VLEFKILGPLEVRDGDRAIALPGRKARVVLAALLLRAGEEVSADRLIEDVWGEQAPGTARNSLHNHVSALRKVLGADVVVTGASGYALHADDEQIDLGRFRRLVESAQGASDDATRAGMLREALGLWRGPGLADLVYEPLGLLEAPRLEELRLAAHADLIDAELALGRHADLLPGLEALIEAHPFDERLRGQLMLALYRAGRQADALDAYAETRRFLVDELGIEPSQPLRDLQHALLQQSESLVPATTAPPALLPSRRTVTILFAELAGSADLEEHLDPEALRRAHEGTIAVARAAVERHGGTMEKALGDEVLAVFGVPSTHEDDALRALRTAVELRAELGELDANLQPRIGVNTGEVFVGGPGTSDLLVTGVALSVARRLQEAAGPTEIMLGPSTFGLVREAVRSESRETISLGRRKLGAWRLVEVVEGAPAIPRRFGAPLAGRDQELRGLELAFDTARDRESCEVVVLAGEAGIGKTRLARELCEKLSDSASVLVGQCVPYGEGATWLPVVEALRSRLGEHPAEQLAALLVGDERAAQTVAALVDGADAPSSTAEVFWAVRRLVEALARERPVVLVLEDAHWAETTLLDFVDYLEGFSGGSATLIICPTRPELFDRRPTWADRATVLERLSHRDVLSLLENLGTAALEPGVRDRVADVAEGNPLLAEQLLAWAAEGGQLDVLPPSVDALLQSRIDLLPNEERTVIERAAVVGREFTMPAARALLPAELTGALRESVFALVRKGLLEPAPAPRLERDGFRFHHALVRDAAYASIPKTDRAGLHERAAEWIEEHDAAQDELVGYHLEQAYRYRAELGRVDRHARGLAADAGDRLGSAGIRAWKRGDVHATVNLLSRATSLLQQSDARRRELLCELGLALRASGRLDEAKTLLAQATQESTASGDRRIQLRARIELSDMELLSNADADFDDFLTTARGAIPVFEAVDDTRSLGRTWHIIGYVQGGFRSQNAAWASAAELAKSYYEQSGWPPSMCVSNLAAALYHGPTPALEGIARCHRLLADASDHTAEASVQAILACFESLRGEFDEARKLANASTQAFERLGQVEQATHTARWARGEIELRAGDAAAAERILRDNCEQLESIHARSHLATAAAELAEALYRLGEEDEAHEWTRVSELHTSPADVHAQVAWRSVRAKVLAAVDLDAAETLALEALALVEQTDAINQHATVLQGLAEVLVWRRAPGAAGRLQAALTLYNQKGNLVGAEETRRRLDALASELTAEDRR
jgi:DNA-binding SARP family transcriptional activator/tetratricopeptide (TPR) repeat protein